MGLLEFIGDVVHQPLIEVVAAKTVVAGSRKDFEYAVADLKNGYIEGTAAKVVNQNLLVGFLIHAVCERRRSRLVDDTQYVESCDLACVLGRLALAVAEVCRNGDNGIGHLLTEICLRILLELLEDHCGDLLGSVALAVDGAAVIAAHLTLDGAYGVVGVGDSLTLCNAADETFAALECDD